MPSVYEISFPEGGKYFGVTSRDGFTRFREHIRDSRKGRERSPVAAKIQQFGEDEVKFNELFSSSEFDHELFYLIEEELIAKQRADSLPCYNTSIGGRGGQTGVKASQEIKQKVSLASKTLWKNPEHKRKMSIARAGEKAHNTTLTDLNALEIRQLVAHGYKQKDVAKLFGVSATTINKIFLRKTWKHVP